MTSSANVAMMTSPFIAFCPGNVSGRPGRMPCSLPKAIKLPVNVKAPSAHSRPVAAIDKPVSPP